MCELNWCIHASIHVYDCSFWIVVFILCYCFCLEFEEDQFNSCDCCACAGCFDQGKWYTMAHYFLHALEFSSSMHDRWFNFSKYMLCLEHPVVCSHPETLLCNFSSTWLLSSNAVVSFWLCCLWNLKINNLNETPGWIEPCLVAEWNVDRHPGTKRFVGLLCFS